MTKTSYRQAGVNIDAANEVKRGIAGLLQSKGVTLNRPNAFSAIVDAGLKNYDDPVLVLKSEEPGSKQLIAFENDRVESVCTDMVNHLVNDCIVCGATPVSVQDVVVCGTLDPAVIHRIVTAIAEAASAQGCFLSGGETSEQPGVLPDGRYILSSSIIGVIERSKIVDGSAITPGDTIIGLASSGLHTNGYSLVRHLMATNPDLARTEIRGRPFLDVLLDVHAPYYASLRPLFGQRLVKGAAHITGGGIRENLNRILPPNIDAIVNLADYRTQDIFKIIRAAGRLSDDEMLRTFNLGIGMAIVVAADDVPQALTLLHDSNTEAWTIGKTVTGAGRVVCENSVPWNGP
jgi:phosphoribosylformylglycinamidine cyclo-ligase